MKYILILFYFITVVTYSQSVTKDEIFGVWICKRISLSETEPMSPEEKALADNVKDGFIGSKFTLGEDEIFKIELPNASPELLGMVEFLDKKSWQLKGNRISISPKENLMHIDVTKGKGFLIFRLFETPFVLSMEKM
jgi:hypothetical protein